MANDRQPTSPRFALRVHAAWAESVSRMRRLIGSLWRSPLTMNVMKVGVGDVLSRVLSVGGAVLIIRGLSVTDYAAYTAFMTVTGMFPGLVCDGVNAALVRFAADRISRTGSRPFDLYIVALVFQVLLYLLLCLLLLLFSEQATSLMFGAKAYGLSLRLGLLAGLASVVMRVGRSVYQAEERFGVFVKTLWLRQVGVLAVVVLLFVRGMLSFKTSALALLVVDAAVAAIITHHVFHDVGLKKLAGVVRGQAALVREFVASTGWLIVYNLLLVVFGSLDVLMLSHMSTEAELARYGVAYRYYSVCLLLLGSIHAVLLPRFSRADMQETAPQRSFARRWMLLTGLLAFPIAAGAVLVKPLFVLINAQSYEGSYPVFLILTVGVWVSLTCSPLVNVLKSRKAFKFLVVLAFQALVFNLLGNYFLIPLYGCTGTAVVTVVSHALINVTAATRVFFSAK